MTNVDLVNLDLMMASLNAIIEGVVRYLAVGEVAESRRGNQVLKMWLIESS